MIGIEALGSSKPMIANHPCLLPAYVGLLVILPDQIAIKI
jgi:hypothetical protein